MTEESPSGEIISSRAEHQGIHAPMMTTAEHHIVVCPFTKPRITTPPSVRNRGSHTTRPQPRTHTTQPGVFQHPARPS